MVVEPVYSGWMWRCVNCGNRWDRTIMLNRRELAAFADDLRQAQYRDIREWSMLFGLRIPA